MCLLVSYIVLYKIYIVNKCVLKLYSITNSIVFVSYLIELDEFTLRDIIVNL